MAKKVEDLNLYQVHVRGNCYANQIEATSDQQARAIAAGQFKTTIAESECKIIGKEPVYEETIGVECDESPSESAVFEIRVRGVDEARVEQLAKAIYTFIGGPGMPEKDYGKIHSARPLTEATCDMTAYI